jgi:hypothetical protein
MNEMGRLPLPTQEWLFRSGRAYIPLSGNGAHGMAFEHRIAHVNGIECERGRTARQRNATP